MTERSSTYASFHDYIPKKFLFVTLLSLSLSLSLSALSVMPRFPKYVKKESQRESATYIQEENTPHIHAKYKIT